MYFNDVILKKISSGIVVMGCQANSWTVWCEKSLFPTVYNAVLTRII